MSASQDALVAEFNTALNTLTDTPPPVANEKLLHIARVALQQRKFYKLVVHCVERFLSRCKAEYKVPALLVIDRVCRLSKDKLSDKDIFAPRFAKNLEQTFRVLLRCGSHDKEICMTVLQGWVTSALFPVELTKKLTAIAVEAGAVVTEASQAGSLIGGNSVSTVVTTSGSGLAVVDDFDYGDEDDDADRIAAQKQRIIEAEKRSQDQNASSNAGGGGGGVPPPTAVSTTTADLSIDMAGLTQASLLDILSKVGQIPSTATAATAGASVNRAPPPPSTVVTQPTTTATTTAVAVDPRQRRGPPPPPPRDSIQPQISTASPAVNLDSPQQQDNAAALQQMLAMASSQSGNSNPQLTGMIMSLVAQTGMQLPTPQQAQQQQQVAGAGQQGSLSQGVMSQQQDNSGNFQNASSTMPWEMDRNVETPMQSEHPNPNYDGRLRISSTTMWLGNVGRTITEQMIRDIIEPIGKVLTFMVNVQKCCAFIVMETRQICEAARDRLSEANFEGEFIKLGWGLSRAMKSFPDHVNRIQGTADIPEALVSPQQFRSFFEGSEVALNSIPPRFMDLIPRPPAQDVDGHKYAEERTYRDRMNQPHQHQQQGELIHGSPQHYTGNSGSGNYKRPSDGSSNNQGERKRSRQSRWETTEDNNGDNGNGGGDINHHNGMPIPGEGWNSGGPQGTWPSVPHGWGSGTGPSHNMSQMTDFNGPPSSHMNHNMGGMPHQPFNSGNSGNWSHQQQQ